jgi:hypothetical protein
MAMLTSEAPAFIEHAQQSVTFTPYDCRWIPSSPMFVVLGSNPRGTGVINIYQLTPSETKLVTGASKFAYCPASVEFSRCVTKYAVLMHPCRASFRLGLRDLPFLPAGSQCFHILIFTLKSMHVSQMATRCRLRNLLL